MSELNYKELQEQGVFDIPYKAFGVCCSSARDILDAYYQGRFVLVNERDLEKFLWRWKGIVRK